MKSQIIVNEVNFGKKLGTLISSSDEKYLASIELNGDSTKITIRETRSINKTYNKNIIGNYTNLEFILDETQICGLRSEYNLSKFGLRKTNS